MKTMKYSIMCFYVMSYLFAATANATGSPCNLTIDISNSNCNDNFLKSGKKSCDCDTSDCKDCDSCCECLEVRFDSTFSFPNFNAMFVDPSVVLTIAPFVQEPNCRVTVGDAAVITVNTNEVSINQCLKVCLRCDAEYKVGYTIVLQSPTLINQGAFEDAAQTRNNDSVCFCGKSLQVGGVTQGQLVFLVLGGQDPANSPLFSIAPFTPVTICCCDCPPPSCAGCSCLGPDDDCVLPFVEEYPFPAF